MCRMIFCVGKVNTGRLIDNLKIIAQGKNEINEHNTSEGKFRHKDGWGMAYRQAGEWFVYKTTKPIFEDEETEKLKRVECEAIILHTRYLTLGSKNLSNTQPILSKNKKYVLAHNGTIKDEFVEIESDITDSDTVKWFKTLIKKFERKEIKRFYEMFPFSEYTSANCFFITPARMLVCQNYTINPEYHTLKLHRSADCTIVSSEKLPHLRTEKWIRLPNKSVIELKC